ncbi:MAG: 2-oxo acid dehydrogenase subunit E2 [Candidatus Nanopelagicales bacterium]
MERAVVRDGQIVIRPMLPLTVSFDHGVIDGAPAARFIETLRELTGTAAALPEPGDAGVPIGRLPDLPNGIRAWA